MYEVPEEVLHTFKHELMATSVGISSQTILKPASYACFMSIVNKDGSHSQILSTIHAVLYIEPGS